MEEKKEKTEKDKKLKERFKTILIIILIIIIILLLLRRCEGETSKEAVIVEDTTVELKDTSDGNIRVKLNPVIDVKDGVLENLDFSNFNEERLLKIKIKVDDKYIYESDFIKPSEILERDYIEDNNIELDGKEAIAEIYSYTTSKEMVGQTNVVIKLNDN